MTQSSFYVHPTAEVSPEAHIGAGTRIWRQAHIREFAHIGETCNIGKGVYIDTHVQIGSCVNIKTMSLSLKASCWRMVFSSGRMSVLPTIVPLRDNAHWQAEKRR